MRSASRRWQQIGLTVALGVCVAAGLWFRASNLDGVGLAEDEVNKIDAIRAYERGDFTVNAEHPLLMKSLCWLSLRAAGWWNARVDQRSEVSEETALRAPNAVTGALTAVPIYLLGAALFDPATGLLGAALWSVGPGPVTLNRIAKEDTLVVAFMLLALYAYLQAKTCPRDPSSLQRRWYTVSGASFGLMMASKYFPHYFAVNLLYHHLMYRQNVRHPPPGERRGGRPILVFYVATVVAFLVANPTVLLPSTWQYLLHYTGGGLRTHHGYLLGTTLYENNFLSLPGRALPWWFYLALVAIKTPLAVLAATIVGLVVVTWRRTEQGPLFLLVMIVMWIVPFSLVGAKWSRYTLTLWPFIDLVAAVGAVWAVRAIGTRAVAAGAGRVPAFAAAASVTAACVLAPAFSLAAAAPHYSLWTNALGTPGALFPHDEFYDAGVREALEVSARCAPPGTTVATETPGLAAYYLPRFGRTDLRIETFSDPDFDFLRSDVSGVALVQIGRTYFENQDELRDLKAAADGHRISGCGGGTAGVARTDDVVVGGLSAVEMYTSSAAAAADLNRR